MDTGCQRMENGTAREMGLSRQGPSRAYVGGRQERRLGLDERRTRYLDTVDWTVSGHLEYRERLRIQIEDGDDWRMLSG